MRGAVTADKMLVFGALGLLVIVGLGGLYVVSLILASTLFVDQLSPYAYSETKARHEREVISAANWTFAVLLFLIVWGCLSGDRRHSQPHDDPRDPLDAYPIGRVIDGVFKDTPSQVANLFPHNGSWQPSSFPGIFATGREPCGRCLQLEVASSIPTRKRERVAPA